MRTGYYQQAAVAGKDIVKIDEDGEVVAEDAALAGIVARALPAEVFARTMQVQGFDLLAIDQQRAHGKRRPAVGEFHDDGPVARVRGQDF